MPLRGLAELQANLRKVNSWTNPAIKRALEEAAGNTINHIKTKQEHIRGKSLSKKTAAQHPDKHFYVWTQKLLNSIRRSEVTVFINGAEIEIRVGGPQVDYAAVVEMGGPNRKAYPFLQPGLEDTQEEDIRIMARELSKVFG